MTVISAVTRPPLSKKIAPSSSGERFAPPLPVNSQSEPNSTNTAQPLSDINPEKRKVDSRRILSPEQNDQILGFHATVGRGGTFLDKIKGPDALFKSAAELSVRDQNS